MPPLASSSQSLYPCLVLYVSSLLYPGPFGMMHIHSPCHTFATLSSSILSVVCPFPRPSLPPLSPHSLDGFKWPQGKLFGVQVEFRRRPGSPSLFYPSKPTRESLPRLPPDTGSASELKAPRMAIVIQSPVPRTLCLIKWAAAATFDIGLTCVWRRFLCFFSMGGLRDNGPLSNL